MKSRNLLTFLIALLFVASGCKKENITTNTLSGEALVADQASKVDFTRYIAVGNSITSGYSNGGLYLDGQRKAYPNIIAEQMKMVGGGPFFSPLFPVSQLNGSGYLRLAGFNADGSPNIVPVTDRLAIRGQITIPYFGPVTLYTKYSGDINNYGVPGLKLQEITYGGYGNLNGYYERLLPGVAGTNTTSYLDFVTAKPFTFFSDWLGNNDVLGYATSGGEGDVLTDKSEFAALYNLSVATFTKNGAKGVLASIPNLTSLPYFTTITVNALVAAAHQINPAFNNVYISALNPANGTYITRAATNNDLILLPFKTSELGSTVNNLPGYGLIPQNPLSSAEVLDAAEVAKVQDYISFYNKTIKAIAYSYGLAFFDSYAFLNNINAGLVMNGVYVDTKYITGGVISLDGIHLTPRGNALTANAFIKAINEKFATNIPMVDISQYKGVL